MKIIAGILKKKKTEINHKYKDSIFSAFHRYWARFTATQKRKKEEGQLPDRPLSKSCMNFFVRISFIWFFLG